jgi:hypothetical protein
MMQATLFPERQPLVVAYGIGVDSTAMLVAMQQRGIRPDMILTADTEAEKPETYAYLPIINAWLAKVGFPQVTIVRYEPKVAPYKNLEGACFNNQVLPSLAYGGHSCSLRFKVEPQNKYLRRWQPAIDAWAVGMRVIKAIGYDNGDQDCRRRAKADRANAKKLAQNDIDTRRYEYWYPLQEWGIDRVECLRLIAMAGLPCPVKSACYFCPASKKSEVIWLRDHHPVLFQKAIAMERNALEGKHTAPRLAAGKKISTKGLGRNFAWAELEHVKAEEVVDAAETLRP